MPDTAPMYPNQPDAGSILTIVPVAGRIGGEVQGLTLTPDLDTATLEALHAALARHKVLFFRDQHQFDDAAHQAFGRRWGQPVTHPTAPQQTGDFLLELNSKEGGKSNMWHTDVTFTQAYPAGAILRAAVIPPAGGDTCWANTVEAYARLPAPLRALADTLWAVHSNEYDYAINQTERDAGMDAYQAEFVSTVFEAEHPLVRIHPVTGEKTMVLGAFFKAFVGMNSADSRRLYDTFQAHITRLENTVRWRWRSGDVVIWDNRATQHYAIDDIGDQLRVVRRVAIGGDVPVAVDGRRSRQLLPAAMPELRVA